MYSARHLRACRSFCFFSQKTNTNLVSNVQKLQEHEYARHVCLVYEVSYILGKVLVQDITY